jgi:hypothetical protein
MGDDIVCGLISVCCISFVYHAERVGDVNNSSRWWQAEARATFAKRSRTTATTKPYQKVTVEQDA